MILGAGLVQLQIMLRLNFGLIVIKLYWAVIMGFERIFSTKMNVYKRPMKKNWDYNKQLNYAGVCIS